MRKTILAIIIPLCCMGSRQIDPESLSLDDLMRIVSAGEQWELELHK